MQNNNLPLAAATASDHESFEAAVGRLASMIGECAYALLIPLAWIAVALVIAAVLTRLAPFFVSRKRRARWSGSARFVAELSFMVGFAGTLVGVIGATENLGLVTQHGYEIIGPDIAFALGTTNVGLMVSMIALVAKTILGPESQDE
ncbi:MAG: MotA/TolQ/ExbB proton channel family protein [Planctomycetota bacterium]